MIQISCPNNNIPERTYAIDALFSDILGCNKDNYIIQFRDDVRNYELTVNNHKLTIEDHFFNHHPEPLSYFKLKNIPNGLIFFHGHGYELPIIYGEDIFEKDDDRIVVGLDIFASTFFMLTRWEEFLLGREEKGDCDEAQLFSVQYGIFSRPIVNEYADFLRSLLPSFIPFSSRKYQVVLTHDVDGFVTPSWKKVIKDLIRQTIHGEPKNKILNLTWKEEIKYRMSFPTDYSQFDLYTTLSDRYNIIEWFYIKVCNKGEKEATYFFDDRRLKGILNKLKEDKDQNIVIGFHPSQNVFAHIQQWEREVARICGLLQCKPIIGRNHHLLYNHELLRLWENVSNTPLNISNCVFHRRQGFRSGVCVPYHLFDLYQRRVMNLIEHPCQIMDTVIRYDEHIKSYDERWRDIKDCIDYVRKYQGELVLTWHIYIRNKTIIQNYFQWCEKVVAYAI